MKRALSRLLRPVLAAAGLVAALGCSAAAEDAFPMTTRDFAFVSAGITLSGVIDQPTGGMARALVVFVHGYGPTDVRGWSMYADLRGRFATLGIASATWDKPGRGRSEGDFDIDQPVEDGAREVLDAVAHLRAQGVPGSDRIGMWGISRAGWIVPIALSRDPDVDFWISVSGVTAEDNFLYLLESNWPLEGRNAEETERLSSEWKGGLRIFRSGGSYEAYRSARAHILTDPFLTDVMGVKDFADETTYRAAQEAFLGAENVPVEPETGMTIFVDGFDAILRGLDVHVLALFGEKDRNVDWRKTRALYEASIGRNHRARLTVRTFPDANHNIDVSETGGIREMRAMREHRKSQGYYEAQLDWLRARVLR
jgi:hypothetical protein